jgi:hypothetical protein
VAFAGRPPPSPFFDTKNVAYLMIGSLNCVYAVISVLVFQGFPWSRHHLARAIAEGIIPNTFTAQQSHSCSASSQPSRKRMRLAQPLGKESVDSSFVFSSGNIQIGKSLR